MRRIAQVLIFGLLGFSVHSQAWEVLPKTPPIPEDNPLTEKKVELGKKLYFDPRISKTGKVSCNSCHDVRGSGTDNQPVSEGVDGQKGGRNAPTVWNSAFWTVQFWDGRAKSLEDQAKGPMINPVEMGMKDHQAVVDTLSQIEGYKKEFKEVFGPENSLTIDNVAKAIAAYERTLITPDSPYDRYLRGDKKALSASAKRGMKLTQTVGCMACHNGPHFNGPQIPSGFYMKFPNIPGSSYDQKYDLLSDPGRYAVTKNEADRHFWRVSSWRNVAITGPYFHNGRVKTLDEAVRVMAKTQLARDLKDKEVKDIVAFLESLTGQRPVQKEPKLPQ
ncbi:MAG: cytochrome-c peroxidase [Bdellovibrionia bacterium]